MEQTTALVNGRWSGSYDRHYEGAGGHWRDDRGWEEREPEGHHRGKASEKLVVPTFDGESTSEQDLGKSARSYLRKIQVWLRCTRMPADQRALALYNELSGRAWVYAEELDMDILATENGVSYYLEWIQTRFMEVEITKVSTMMSDLFRKCRRRSDQSVRDFNVEFERLVLRLHEVQCELPPLVKAWLYLDKLRLSETEELALLSSVNNKFDVKRLQQAALIQDRSLRKPGGPGLADKAPWKSEGKWGGNRHSVHMTQNVEETSADESDGMEDGLVSEDVAEEAHVAYMTYQNAKAKYREAVKGRGADMDEIRKRSEERLRLAKQRSYCSACKRRGHWHKDPECPLRGKRPEQGRAEEVQMTMHSAQVCDVVHACYMMANDEAADADFISGGLLAIVDTACARTVAGYDWFEKFCEMCDHLSFEVKTFDHEEHFRFGASRVYASQFGVIAWFATQKRWFAVRVAIVPCKVPLLFSRPILAGLGMTYDVAAQKAQLNALSLADVPLLSSPTGHPALNVNEFAGSKHPPWPDDAKELYIPSERAYIWVHRLRPIRTS